tara:strand:+ start:6127 stop:6945 length:819 start_codon:yes stop_codon:yes gene_type:complete
MLSIRKAAVAGQFYPGDPLQLQEMISALLSEADMSDHNSDSSEHKSVQPKAIIVPHAGYIYSGLVAASAFVSLLPFRKKITRIVLLGPSHRVGFSGLAVSSADSFQTPLGDIPVDKESVAQILSLPQVSSMDEAHQFEHSLEVELPFLQEVLDDFRLIPIVVGDTDAPSVSEVLELLWGSEETLIVISSDLSHFHDYKTAQQRDEVTCQAIESLSPELINDDDACGRNPIKGMLVSAQKHHLRVTTLALCNSGDTAGDKARVVGYGAWALTP